MSHVHNWTETEEVSLYAKGNNYDIYKVQPGRWCAYCGANEKTGKSFTRNGGDKNARFKGNIGRKNPNELKSPARFDT